MAPVLGHLILKSGGWRVSGPPEMSVEIVLAYGGGGGRAEGRGAF